MVSQNFSETGQRKPSYALDLISLCISHPEANPSQWKLAYSLACISQVLPKWFSMLQCSRSNSSTSEQSSLTKLRQVGGEWTSKNCSFIYFFSVGGLQIPFLRGSRFAASSVGRENDQVANQGTYDPTPRCAVQRISTCKLSPILRPYYYYGPMPFQDAQWIHVI